jgi:hypothetical protein
MGSFRPEIFAENQEMLFLTLFVVDILGLFVVTHEDVPAAFEVYCLTESLLEI